MLIDVRCVCGRLLGRVLGLYQIKCARCKRIIEGTTIKGVGDGH